MNLRIQIGRGFEFDTGHGLYIRVIGIGAAYRHPSGEWTFNTWADLKRTGEV